MPRDDAARPTPRLVGSSAFLVQSAALDRGADAGTKNTGAAAAARSALADRNAAGIGLLRHGRPAQAAEARQAEETLRAVVSDCVLALGPQDPDTLIAVGNWAVAHAQAGYVMEAVELLETNLASRALVFGDRHPRTLDARDALGTGLRLAGRAAEATQVHALVGDQRGSVLGRDHPDTLVSRLGLALDIADAGDLDQAAGELNWLLHARTALRPDHPLSTAIWIAAADIALALGWIDRAVSQLQLAYAATEALQGPAHPETVALWTELTAAVAERDAG